MSDDSGNGVSVFAVYQAVMRKFTLALKASLGTSYLAYNQQKI